MPQDFYDLLGLSLGASESDIKQGYREMVKVYHPDKNDNPNAARQFQTLKVARDTLLSDSRRERYNQLGHKRYVRSYGVDTRGFSFTGRNYRPAESEATSSIPEKIENIPFKPKVNPIVSRSIITMLSVSLVYFFAAIQFLTAANSQTSGGLTPDGTVEVTGGDAVTIETFTSSPLLFSFPIMAIVLAAVSLYIVKKLGGRKEQWLYVYGLSTPINFMIVVSIMNRVTPEVIEYIRVTGNLIVAQTLMFVPSVLMTLFLILIPALTITIFIFDISYYVLTKYAQFYIQRYNAKIEWLQSRVRN